MFNQDYFNSLSDQEKEIINDLYHSHMQQEITAQEFLESIRENLGDEIFKNLLLQTYGEPVESKPEQLSDILQYSGIDLKHEQEAIIGLDLEQEQAIETEDPHMQPSSLVDDTIFYEFVNKIVIARGMNIAEDGYNTLFMVLNRKINEMIERIIEASKIRIDIERSEFEKNILNDVKRQLWILEQNEQKLYDSLQIKHEDEIRKKVKKTIQEREDLVVKKRLSNTVALAALGSRKFNWMDETTNNDRETVMESLYAPYDEKEFSEKVKNRTITHEDFLYVLEHDKRYNKSYFLLYQYFNGL